jgi:hypothetical protein
MGRDLSDPAPVQACRGRCTYEYIAESPCRALSSAECSRVGQSLWSRYGLINVIYVDFKVKNLRLNLKPML